MPNSWAENQDRNEDDGRGYASAGRRVHQLVATGVLVVVKDYLKFCHADTKVRENPLRRRNPERG